ARSFGSLQGAFHSFSTRLAMTGTLALSSIASTRVAAARLAAPARKFRRENSLSIGITLLKVVTMIHRYWPNAQAGWSDHSRAPRMTGEDACPTTRSVGQASWPVWASWIAAPLSLVPQRRNRIDSRRAQSGDVAGQCGGEDQDRGRRA